VVTALFTAVAAPLLVDWLTRDDPPAPKLRVDSVVTSERRARKLSLVMLLEGRPVGARTLDIQISNVGNKRSVLTQLILNPQGGGCGLFVSCAVVGVSSSVTVPHVPVSKNDFVEVPLHETIAPDGVTRIKVTLPEYGPRLREGDPPDAVDVGVEHDGAKDALHVTTLRL
jgi:hypothetical protein